MSLGHGNKIVTDGLVFAYDMYLNDTWVNKSYKGKPTVNYAWSQNPRVDTSYTSYVATTSGTWTSKHPKAIRVYNKAGSQITGYINSGVTDWTNTYHAVWEYDSELNRPVVVMRDIGNGSWMAKNFSLGKTYAQMGLTNGDTYTISWLQWVNDLNQAANAGLYGTNTSSSNGFHDGLARSYATAYNTKTYTWQRVYATFTIAATNNLTTNRSCYMYGHYGGRGITKIADVQIEAGAPSTFIAENSEANSTRSNTEAILDWTGNNTITANSLTYNSDGTFSFTQQGHNISVDSNGFTLPGAKTLSIWIRSDRPLSASDNWEVGFLNQGSTSGSMFGFMYGVGNCQDLGFWGYGSPYDMSIESITNKWSSDGNWHNGVITMDASRNVRVYIDGQPKQWLKHSDYTTKVDFVTLPIDTTNYFLINSRGAWNGGMSYVDLGNVSVYNRALTAAEVQQNFNALRGRYSI